MGCMLLLLAWSIMVCHGEQGGGVTMTTGLLRGLGLLLEKGKGECACNEPGARLVVVVYVRACVRAYVEGVGAG